MTGPQKEAIAIEPPENRRTHPFFENLPIQIKAFLALAVPLICLISLGAIAYITLSKSEADFHFLSSSVVPKQRAFALVNNNVVAIETKIFRYVSWASNGVNKTLLGDLRAEIDSDLRLTDFDFKNLSQRTDLTATEKLDLADLIAKWRQYESAARDTLDIGSTDAAMATMTLGQADDKFGAVADGVKAMSNSVTLTTDQISRDLYTDYARKKNMLAAGAIVALLLSIIATVLVSRSIVTPIRSVTSVMRQLSAGDTDVEIGYRDRRDEIGQMVDAINVFRRNAIEKRAMEIESLETEKRNMREIAEARARLTDAIETISEGFSLYDADDKLVIFNSKFKNSFAAHGDIIKEGTSFEAIARTAAEAGNIDGAKGGLEGWLVERTAQHKAASSTHIQHRRDGRWIRVSERRTEGGGTVAVYSDITELKQHEEELTEKSNALAALSSKLAKYLAPQVYDTIFTGQQDVKIVSKRKKLTVCFSDLVGFTEITDKMESEDLTQLLNSYLTEMSKIAMQYGATIDKYVGDAIVMFFGDPATLGVREDALACVQMAIAMQRRVGELAREWLDMGIATPLQCRIGVHTGYCTVGNFGSDDRMDYTMVGGTVNLASRLEHEAPPGGILVSFETYALVKDKVRCDERGAVQVKGIAQPVMTYLVSGLKNDADQAGFGHLKIELEVGRMSDAERKAAADELRRALLRLEQSGRDNN
jgi:class 3 adenylate cyclase/HAMP domain-containing protein